MEKSIANQCKSIYSINPHNNRYYLYRNGQASSPKSLKFKKEACFAALISNRSLISGVVSVSQNIPDEDLDGAIEDKVYEEFGLDVATEYIIRYYQSTVHPGEGRIFNVFILDKTKYEEAFAPVLEKTRYLDFVIPAPLLYTSLYKLGVIEAKKKTVHCFLYFTTYDTYIVFYQNGEYLYSKSMNYSLNEMYDRYCEIAGKTVDKKQFLRVFQKEGVKTTHLEYQQNLIRLFNELFININDIIIYTKRAFNVDVIDQMFIGSELGPISGADEYAQNYLGLYSTPMLFNLNIQSEEWYLDQQQSLLVKAVELLAKEEFPQINLSLNPRPPVLYKRPSGQFLFSLIAASILASSYPLYFLVSSFMLQAHNSQLKEKNMRLSMEAGKYKALISSKKKDLDKLRAKADRERKTYIEKEKTLISVYKKKVDYQLKSDQIAAFARDLSKFGLNVDKIQTDQNNYKISIVAPSDKNITSMIKNLTEKYSDHIGSINIKRIYNDNNTSLYKGVLEVKLK